MNSDNLLFERIKSILQNLKNLESKKMFGGIAFLHRGNMVCGIHKGWLILRLGLDEAEKAMELPFVKAFDITGRPMKGWVMLSNEGFATDENLNFWITKAKIFVDTLPEK